MSGENGKLREYLAENHPGVILLEPGHCDEAVLGMSGGKLVYGYEELCESYAREFSGDAENDDDAYSMGVDWVEYNTLRSLPYMGAMAPVVVVYDPVVDGMVDQADCSDEPAVIDIDRDIPGLN